MKYTYEDKNVTKRYDVVIDDVELENIIEELNTKCCRALKKKVRVTSSSREEAMERINPYNNNGISVVSEEYINDNYRHLNSFSRQQSVFDCEFYVKQISYLAYLLAIVLNNYRSKAELTEGDNEIIDAIIDYENSEELKTYEERMAEHGITEELYFEYENNQSFDFELLRSLYQRAMNCFKLILISDTIHYDPNDKTKVYKLGRR